MVAAGLYNMKGGRDGCRGALVSSRERRARYFGRFGSRSAREEEAGVRALWREDRRRWSGPEFSPNRTARGWTWKGALTAPTLYE